MYLIIRLILENNFKKKIRRKSIYTKRDTFGKLKLPTLKHTSEAVRTFGSSEKMTSQNLSTCGVALPNREHLKSFMEGQFEEHGVSPAFIMGFPIPAREVFVGTGDGDFTDSDQRQNWIAELEHMVIQLTEELEEDDGDFPFYRLDYGNNCQSEDEVEFQFNLIGQDPVSSEEEEEDETAEEAERQKKEEMWRKCIGMYYEGKCGKCNGKMDCFTFKIVGDECWCKEC